MQAKLFVVEHTADIRIVEYPQCPVCGYMQRIGKLCYYTRYLVP